MKKSFAVFGMGRFGSTLALELCKSGAEVLAVDTDKEKVNMIADSVTCAVQADVKDMDTLESLGIRNMDCVVVCMTEDLESSIMAIIKSKELGVPYVIAKAKNSINKDILEKVGADRVIFPEKEAGIRMARNLVSDSFVDYFGLSDDVSVVEVKAKDQWIGQSLKNLDLRKQNKINVVGIKYENTIIVDIDPDKPIEEGAILIVIGQNNQLNKL